MSLTGLLGLVPGKGALAATVPAVRALPTPCRAKAPPFYR